RTLNSFPTRRSSDLCDEQTERGSGQSEQQRLNELLSDKPSPAGPERCAQGKFTFPLDHAREQQTSEVRRRDQQRTDCSPDDDKRSEEHTSELQSPDH